MLCEFHLILSLMVSSKHILKSKKKYLTIFYFTTIFSKKQFTYQKHKSYSFPDDSTEQHDLYSLSRTKKPFKIISFVQAQLLKASRVIIQSSFSFAAESTILPIKVHQQLLQESVINLFYTRLSRPCIGVKVLLWPSLQFISLTPLFTRLVGRVVDIMWGPIFKPYCTYQVRRIVLNPPDHANRWSAIELAIKMGFRRVWPRFIHFVFEETCKIDDYSLFWFVVQVNGGEVLCISFTFYIRTQFSWW